MGLLHQLEAENQVKEGKDAGVKSALAKMKTNAFIVTLAGATDVYRREQILSQQCQKIDQHIFEVTDNLKVQTEKIQEMLNGLTDGKDLKDWTIEDVDQLDGHLWANLKEVLTEIINTGKFRHEELSDVLVRERVTRQSTLENFVTQNESGECKPGIVKGLKQVKSYTADLIDALKRRFGEDFKSPFIGEIKELLDFNYMLEFEQDMKLYTETYENCLVRLEERGVESLRKILRRQDGDSPPTDAEVTKMEQQFKEFKKFAFDLIADVDMTKDKKVIKSAAVTETAVCLQCHQRFEILALIKHVNTVHKHFESVQCQDQIKTFSSIKVLHGMCQQEKFYIGKQDFISLSLKLLCKTPNEAVVESMGSMLQKHMKPERNAKQSVFDDEMHIDWNGPVLSRADSLLEMSLDRKFGSRKQWNFKSGESKFYTSKVVDRKKAETSRLSFLNEH